MEQLQGAQIMSGDQAYLETYQQIYQLFCGKAQVLYGNPHTFENPKALTQELYIELERINEEIRRVEKDFWVSVERCKAAGQVFSVERIADFYKIDAFERRIMLFLIFFRINQPGNKGCYPEQIIQMLDINNSVTERFKNLAYFSKRSSAFVKEVLMVSQKGSSKGQDIAYQINTKIMQQISMLVSGEWSEDQQVLGLLADRRV